VFLVKNKCVVIITIFKRSVVDPDSGSGAFLSQGPGMIFSLTWISYPKQEHKFYETLNFE
jgi:hypothetical protein